MDRFLAGLPKGWPYGVEIRNKYFLKPEYFDTLKRHGVAHVFNSWADMPPVTEQLAQAGSFTNPEFAGARFLLKPGRKYQDAVDLFSPYDKIKEPYVEARTAAAELISRALLKRAIRKLFLLREQPFGRKRAIDHHGNAGSNRVSFPTFFMACGGGMWFNWCVKL